MGKGGGNDTGRKCVEVKEMEEAKALLPYGMVSARRIKGEPSRFAYADGTRVGRRPRGGGHNPHTHVEIFKIFFSQNALSAPET